MPRRFAQENFTSGRRRRPISLSMLKVPIANPTTDFPHSPRAESPEMLVLKGFSCHAHVELEKRHGLWSCLAQCVP